MRDGLDREAAPRSHDAPGLVIARWIAQGQDDLVIAAEGGIQALLPVLRAQPIFLGLGAVADGLELLTLEW